MQIHIYIYTYIYIYIYITLKPLYIGVVEFEKRTSLQVQPELLVRITRRAA